MKAFPLVGSYIPVNIEKKVVLPAPFGPSNPKISLSFRCIVKLFNDFLFLFLGSFDFKFDGYIFVNPSHTNGYFFNSNSPLFIRSLTISISFLTSSSSFDSLLTKLSSLLSLILVFISFSLLLFSSSMIRLSFLLFSSIILFVLSSFIISSIDNSLFLLRHFLII